MPEKIHSRYLYLAGVPVLERRVLLPERSVSCATVSGGDMPLGAGSRQDAAAGHQGRAAHQPQRATAGRDARSDPALAE